MEKERERKNRTKTEWLIKEYEVYTSFKCSCRAAAQKKKQIEPSWLCDDDIMMWDHQQAVRARVFQRKKQHAWKKIPLIPSIFFVARVP